MRDEEYRPDQIPEYGLPVQPHLAELGKHTFRIVALGAALALLSFVAALLAALVYPSVIGGGGRGEARYALWCALLMLAITVYQALAWRLAWMEWSGRRDFTLNAFALVSYIIHFVSYAVVLVGMWFMLNAMAVAGVGSVAFWLSAVAVLALIAAQIVGATEYLRRGGPPGTLPAHMRELIAFNKHRNEHTPADHRSNLDVD